MLYLNVSAFSEGALRVPHWQATMAQTGLESSVEELLKKNKSNGC